MKDNTVRQIAFKDGDGGGGVEGIDVFQINAVDNGYIVTIIDDEGYEYVYVEKALDDVISLLREFMV